MSLASIDYFVVAVYGICLIAIATFVSRPKAGHERDTKDYFLAGKALPWWAIGASLIAANISAEQVIGMSGSGYAIGLAIASYEWMAAITLVIVGKFFLPIFLEKRIYTMPQFLEQRYDGSVRAVMAVFWLGVYTFVNLTSILWLGALTIGTLTGFPLSSCLIGLAAFTAAYSLYGGLKSVALTDIIQVGMLVLGGLLIAWLSLNAVNDGNGAFAGFLRLMEVAPQKFEMILSPDDPDYRFLPGLSVLIGGMWIMNLSYWGFNQYIIQRALAASSIREAQKGIAFAAFLKLLVPILVVFPGIAAFVVVPDLARADQAYPSMMALAPEGVRGLILAALIAAIVSSLGSMMNSIATIFTIDLYRPLAARATEKSLVRLGRTVALSALIIAALAAQPLLGKAEQAFQWLQEFTGFFTPGVVTLFALGMFWRRATARGAFAAAVGSALFSLAFKIWLPKLPFMNRVGYVFLLCVATAVAVSLFTGPKVHPKAIRIGDIGFGTSTGFNVASAVVAAILTGLYWYWW
ncbi:MAG TPA: sodium/solute symporter [Woeseiaceae bacterium]|jgi:SSS family solute:Na+ symporter|nr:sodium/solute symporter [Woeseiaceae bacterium]